MKRFCRTIPSAGPAREALRKKGQFWTPEWIAEAMVVYVLANGADEVFDPAVGAGAFFRAARILEAETGRKIRVSGSEVDPAVLEHARLNGVSEQDLAHVQITDFVLSPPKGPFQAIVANPPYIRHHRLPKQVKEELRFLAGGLMGTALDGRAGLHVYFLLRALQLLGKGGRLAFIMPADTCEGVFASTLWDWITRNYRLDAVVTFSPEASPFPEVDTNPVVFMICNADPRPVFWWARQDKAEPRALKEWALSGFSEESNGAISGCRRWLNEAVATGLSRPPNATPSDGPTLGDFAAVLRGIATGANEFFFLTERQAGTLGIPDEFLLPAIGRTRDVTGDQISPETLRMLAAKGRPTRLFAPDDRPLDQFPPPVREYLLRGEAMKLYERPLLSTRRPWYKMEVRRVPPFLFTYLGRRNARFIRNLAGVRPLTCLLCIYPHQEDPPYMDRLWQVLQHPQTVAGLSSVGKSYGSGAIKVEPRALERLPLPSRVVSETGLRLDLGTERRRVETRRDLQLMLL